LAHPSIPGGAGTMAGAGIITGGAGTMAGAGVTAVAAASAVAAEAELVFKEKCVC